MKIAYASDAGRIRNDNQDYVGVFKNKQGVQLAIVADGVGGEKGGDVAATMAVTHLGNAWEQTEITEMAAAGSWIGQTTFAENEAILQAAQRYRTLKRMATTILMAVIFEDRVGVANLGDSRGYLIRGSQMRQLTHDHNLAQELLDNGSLTEAEAAEHPGRHVLTRQLGVDEVVELEMVELPLHHQDFLLLTTDGMVKHLSDARILTIIKQQHSLSEAVAALVDATNAAGGTDNTTVLLGYQESEA